MTDRTDRETLQPLLDYIEQESDPRLRLAALDAAARFPLDEECWSELALSIRELLDELPESSADRREALRIAGEIPLLSMRRQLRDMADGSDAPDADVVAGVLAAVGDPSQVWPLVALVRGGDPGRLRELAAMPVEDAGLNAADIPRPGEDDDPTLCLWWALVRARLGARDALDAYLAGQVDPPPLFWGSPWSAYDELAAVRPLPADLDAHLREAVSAIEVIDDDDRRRMARLIVWGCTGIADAEGTPQDAPGAGERIGGMATASTGEPVAAAEAAVVAEHLVDMMCDPDVLGDGPAPEELDKLAGLAPEDANRLLVELIGNANRTLEASPSPESLQIHLGNAIINVMERLPVNPGWPIREIASQFLAPGLKALDLEQFAWVLARLSANRIATVLTPEIARAGPSGAGLRLLALLGQVGEIEAGRAGSPWRGSGPGAGAGPARAALIDDEPEMAMRGGIALPAAERQPAPPAPQPAGATPPASEEEEAADLPPELEKRRVNAQIRVRGEKRDTFLAGATNIIRCWIGLPEEDIAAVSDRDIPDLDHIPREGLELVVQLEWDGQSDTTTTRLPAGRTARSGDCDLTLTVPESERYIKADIAFLYRGRVFEHVRVEAAVLAAGETAQSRDRLQVRVQTQFRQVIALEDRREYDATLIYSAEPDADGEGPGAATLLEFGSQGVARYSLDSTGAAVAWLNQELFIADKNLVRSKAKSNAADDEEQRLAADDPEVLGILRQLAQHGTVFYNQLVGQRFKDPGPRLQLLNRTPDVYVPLEFVYDRGYPSKAATLCDGWREALAGDADECPCCGPPPPPHDAARDNTPTICPLGFWSLKKIIERLDPLDVLVAGPGRSVPRDGRRELGPIDRVLFGASHRVKQPDRDATMATLRRTVAHVDCADDWRQWKSAVTLANVPLLLALPHHGTKNNQDFLEIGGAPTPEEDRELEGGRLTNVYVNPNSIDPGPIVLLIGCETGAGSSTGYPALARTFQQLHTSIVVGTLAKVLGRHAAPVAQELVTQLAGIDDPDADFGIVMRRVRRRMLLKGYLMALCIVALGDADWRLARRVRPSVPVGADEV